MLKLSQTDRDRLVVLHQVQQGQLSAAEGARRAGLGARQFRRVRRRFEREGDGVVVHALRGRRSNRRLPEEVREAALEKARQPLYHDFGATLLSEHLEREAICEVAASTLRRWMIAEGLWEPARQGKRHRRRRERRAAFGELVLMDTSIHPWLEARFGSDIVLIALIDDATSRLRARELRHSADRRAVPGTFLLTRNSRDSSRPNATLAQYSRGRNIMSAPN